MFMIIKPCVLPLKKAGFVVDLLEYCDENGTFHYKYWNELDGKIGRSLRFDTRNKDGKLGMVSIIIDAKNPIVIGEKIMATWITHLMIADGVLERIPNLDRHGFCVGNIAPDCNVENEDWTAFTPSREVTHWMQSERKKASDCDAFCDEYILKRKDKIKSAEEYAFLLGYYCHLITDAAFQAMIRDDDRVKATWMRIKADEELRVAAVGMDETWDSVKRLIPKKEHMREIYEMEAEYLSDHPNSGYLTEILPLKSFLDYIDYLPKGSIVRKIGVMGYLPELDKSINKFITMSRDEYANFVEDTIQLVIQQFVEKKLM